MRYDLDGEPELAIGIPLPEQNASYYEIVSLDELQSTLESLAVSLFGASLVTTLAGAALGYWISRRTLRPLSNVGVAAEAIAGGRLDTRLEGGDDPDLEALVTSFNHMAQALEERIERDGRFASDVSHELRSPLMTLAASIEVLATRREEMPDESARAAVDLMAADIARFQQLVDDLLEISRFDAGAARLSLDEVSPVELVHQAVDAVDRPRRADRGRPRPRRARRPGGQATPRAGHRQPARQRREVRRRRHRRDRGPHATATSRSRSRTPAPGVPAEDRELVFERFSRGAGGAGRRTRQQRRRRPRPRPRHRARAPPRRSVRVEDRPDGADAAPASSSPSRRTPS